MKSPARTSLVRLGSLAVAALAVVLIAACSTAPAPREPVNLNVVAKPATQPSGLGIANYKVQEKWDKAVAQFEAIATTRPSKVGGTVFIGSSSFTRWKTLEQDMAEFSAVNRGFGGSKTDDVLYYARRILTPLKPTRIVYFCGSNDLAGKRPAEVPLANFKSFVELVRKDFPGCKVYYVAANAAPKRGPFAAEFDKLNAQVAAWAAQTKDVKFIDGRGGLFDAEGKPFVNLFLKDGVHLTPEGNKIWSAHIAEALRGAGTVTSR